MKQVHVNIINDLDKVNNLEEKLPLEFAKVTGWKNEGILEHMFIKNDRTGAVLIFTGIEENKVKELVPTLPMYKHFDNVEYTTVDKQF